MLIINVSTEEPIDKALKRYKRKFQQTRLMNEMRKRKHFEKPSVSRRNEILNASYRLQKFGNPSDN
jgi:small subunit ribosomal protein S21